jgi:hypothetical protein
MRAAVGYEGHLGLVCWAPEGHHGALGEIIGVRARRSFPRSLDAATRCRIVLFADSYSRSSGWLVSDPCAQHLVG